MKYPSITLSIAILLLFAVSYNITAGEGHNHGSSGHSSLDSAGGSMHNMAKIMMQLNHHPSSSEKKLLRKIAMNSQSAHEKTIAEAMLNLQHKASSADKARLKEIMNDANASVSVKTLAEIVHNLSHKPSRGDKQRLQAMID